MRRTVWRKGKRHRDNWRNGLSSEKFCTCQRDHDRSCSCCFSFAKKRIMKIEYNQEKLEEIQEQFGSETVQNMLDTSIKKSIVMLQRYAIQETPTDQWRLRNWFQTLFKKSYWRLFNPVDYAPYVHDWTRPHSAPFDKIAERAFRHGLNPWSVRYSIRTRWTKANPFMDRAVEQWEWQVDQIFQKEIDKMVLQLNK